MENKYERQMKKGVLDMLVLKLLESGPKYGYQLITELRECGGEVFALKEGTLYPVLYRLEEERLAESSWSEPEGKQVARKYYRITEAGRDALEEIYQTWQRISQAIGRMMGEAAEKEESHDGGKVC